MYARGCASCPIGCNSCYCPNQCNTCFNNLINVGGVCTCSTASGLYYDSVSKTCTSCLVAIPNCLSCSLSGTITKCNTCSPGYYVDPATFLCVKCSTYCTTCTATSCLSCISSTFTISLNSCICTSPLFLKTSPTPVSC